MKNKKYILVGLTSLLIAIVSISYYMISAKGDNNSPSNTPKKETTALPSKVLELAPALPTISNIESIPPPTWGNTPGNIMNEGSFAMQGNYLYFVAYDRSVGFTLMRSMMDGITGLKQFKAPIQNARFLNTAGEWMYFVNQDGSLCKIKVSGTDYTVISPGQISNLILYNDNLYYIDNYTLYKSPLSSPGDAKAIYYGAYSFTISEDGKYLYCINLDYGLVPNKIVIHKVSLNNYSEEKEFELQSNNFVPVIYTYKEYVYLLTSAPYNDIGGTSLVETKILRINTALENAKPEDYYSYVGHHRLLNIQDKYLYIFESENPIKIIRKNLENNTIEKFDTAVEKPLATSFVIDLSPRPFYVFGDKLYFINSSGLNRDLLIYDFATKTIKRNIFR